MRVGDKCELVIAPQPFLAVGAVSEQDVGHVKVGEPASATLVTRRDGKRQSLLRRQQGGRHDAHVPHSKSNCPIQMRKLKDGISADIHVPVKAVQRHENFARHPGAERQRRGGRAHGREWHRSLQAGQHRFGRTRRHVGQRFERRNDRHHRGAGIRGRGLAREDRSSQERAHDRHCRLGGQEYAPRHRCAGGHDRGGRSTRSSPSRRSPIRTSQSRTSWSRSTIQASARKTASGCSSSRWRTICAPSRG